MIEQGQSKNEAAVSPTGENQPRFDTRRLYLRSLTDLDCTEWYVTALNDPEINRFLETRHVPQTLDTIRAFVANISTKDNEFLFGIFLRADNRHIGNIKVGPIRPYHLVGDVSLWIGDKTSWGKGYATEAIVAVSRHAFEVLGVRKLSASMYEPNHRSYRAFIKAGYQDEGRRISHCTFEGGRVDLLVTGLASEKF
jgi:RimJ/RimL family protein N-acetyltransferase